jgi:hypothetical protein
MVNNKGESTMKLKINKAVKAVSNKNFSTIEYLNDNGLEQIGSEFVLDFIPSGFGRGYKKGIRDENPEVLCSKIVALNRALEIVQELENNSVLKSLVQNYSVDGDFVKLSEDEGKGSRSFPIKTSEIAEVPLKRGAFLFRLYYSPPAGANFVYTQIK